MSAEWRVVPVVTKIAIPSNLVGSRRRRYIDVSGRRKEPMCPGVVPRCRIAHVSIVSRIVALEYLCKRVRRYLFLGFRLRGSDEIRVKAIILIEIYCTSCILYLFTTRCFPSCAALIKEKIQLQVNVRLLYLLSEHFACLIITSIAGRVQLIRCWLSCVASFTSVSSEDYEICPAIL